MEYANGILHIHNLSLIMIMTLFFIALIAAFLLGSETAFRHICQKEKTRENLQRKADIIQARLHELEEFPGTTAYEYPQLQADLKQVKDQLNALV